MRTSPGTPRSLCVAVALCVVFVISGLATPAPVGAQPSIAQPASTGRLTQDVAGCGRTELRAGSTTVTRRIGATVRRYRIDVPRGYTGRQPLPAVLAFHGRAETVANFARYTGFSRPGALVVYPEALRGTDGRRAWQGAPYSSPAADDVAFTRAILRDVRSRACIDPARVFAVGRSNGGGMVARLACRLPGEFAAFATVSAAVYERTVAGCAARPISLIDVHGTADGVIGYRGGRRFGERYLSVASWLGMWTRAAGCLPAPVVLPVAAKVDRLAWHVCGSVGHGVVHYRVAGGSHRWPAPTTMPIAGSSGDGSLSSVIWQFFQMHPKRI